jgi:hypothetical protein
MGAGQPRAELGVSKGIVVGLGVWARGTFEGTICTKLRASQTPSNRMGMRKQV